MAKNLPHCEIGFGVYRSAQLKPHPLFLLLYLFVVPTIEKFSTDICWLFTNNEIFIYDSVVVNLGHFTLLFFKLEYVIQKIILNFLLMQIS
jgi:hypothetical protein